MGNGTWSTSDDRLRRLAPPGAVGGREDHRGLRGDVLDEPQAPHRVAVQHHGAGLHLLGHRQRVREEEARQAHPAGGARPGPVLGVPVGDRAAGAPPSRCARSARAACRARSRSVRAISARSWRWASGSRSSLAMRMTRRTGSPSPESQAMPSPAPAHDHAGALQPDRRAWGMAMPGPTHELTRRSRSRIASTTGRGRARARCGQAPRPARGPPPRASGCGGRRPARGSGSVTGGHGVLADSIPGSEPRATVAAP